MKILLLVPVLLILSACAAPDATVKSIV